MKKTNKCVAGMRILMPHSEVQTNARLIIQAAGFSVLEAFPVMLPEGTSVSSISEFDCDAVFLPAGWRLDQSLIELRNWAKRLELDILDEERYCFE